MVHEEEGIHFSNIILYLSHPFKILSSIQTIAINNISTIQQSKIRKLVYVYTWYLNIFYHVLLLTSSSYQLSPCCCCCSYSSECLLLQMQQVDRCQIGYCSEPTQKSRENINRSVMYIYRVYFFEKCIDMYPFYRRAGLKSSLVSLK